MPGAFVNSDLASTLGAAEVFFFFFKEPLAPSFLLQCSLSFTSDTSVNTFSFFRLFFFLKQAFGFLASKNVKQTPKAFGRIFCRFALLTIKLQPALIFNSQL